MKVLWLCNVVLNEFCDEFGIKKKPFGGWMESLFNLLKKKCDYELGLCFPIYDKNRMKNSCLNGHKYYAYSLPMDEQSFSDNMKNEFVRILEDFKPDIVHVWGTECNHALAMVQACVNLGIRDRVIVRIQGLVSVFKYHYTLGIPDQYLDMKIDEKLPSIREEIVLWDNRGMVERETLKVASNILARGDFDEFFVKQINETANVWRVDNTLRDLFYLNRGTWIVRTCIRHRIFVSQASYPPKGVHFLLQAMSVLKKKYPDISLNIAGQDILGVENDFPKTSYAYYLQCLIRENNLQDNVHCIGLLDEKMMIQQYIDAHVFVCPSTIENRANSICEAMMIGTPTVASYVGGNVDVIHHGVDGYMYPVSEFYTLAGFIDKIFSDDTIATNVSVNSTEVAIKRHEKKKIVKQIMKIYEKVTTV